MSQRRAEAVYLWRTPYREVSEVDYAASAFTFLEVLSPDLPAEGTIVLKPNVTLAMSPDSGIIVHPEFVGGLLDALLQRGVSPDRLCVAEGHMPFQADGSRTWTAAGYTEMAERRRVQLVEVDEGEVTEVPAPGGVVYPSVPLAATVTRAAMVINVPIAKCHNLALTTLSIKNMMGMVIEASRHFCGHQVVDQSLGDRLLDVNGRGISLLEERFCHKLVDLASAVKALSGKGLHLVSGLIGRDGTGFGTGDNYLLNLVAASENPVHLDTVVTFLMGIDPLKTPYLTIAAERGLGTNRLEGIEVVDLWLGRRMAVEELERSVHQPAFIPLTRGSQGYQPRFRADNTLVPWALERINHHRERRGLAPIAA